MRYRVPTALLVLAANLLVAPTLGSQLGQLKREGAVSEGRIKHRLFILGEKTPITVNVLTYGMQPQLSIRRAGSRTIHGDVFTSESGAISVSDSIAFIKDGRSLWLKRFYKADASYGSRVLLTPTQGGPWTVVAPAYLYHQGRFVDIGLTSDASFRRDGVVVGYYWSKSDRSPQRDWNPGHHTAIYKQFFIWKGGKRYLKGLQPWEGDQA